jgi:hypothetical protein
MRRLLLFLALAITLPVCVQAKDKPDAAPTIPTDVQLKFFKASALQQSTQHDLEQSQVYKNAQGRQAEFQAMIQEINKVCGDDYAPNLSQDGELTCVARAKLKPQPAPTTQPPAK